MKIFLADLFHTWTKGGIWTIPLNIGYVGSYTKKKFKEENIECEIKLFKDANVLLDKIKEDDDINILGDPKNRISIVSFVSKNAHPHDLALLLDKRGIAIRAGHHCAQPAMRHFNVDTTLRASIGIYNDEEDINYFLDNLKDIKKYF